MTRTVAARSRCSTRCGWSTGSSRRATQYCSSGPRPMTCRRAAVWEAKDMPKAMWAGTITFGLVNIPVRLLPATRRQDVRFHEIDRASGRRIHHQKVVFADWDETVEGESLPRGAGEWPPAEAAAEGGGAAESLPRGAGEWPPAEPAVEGGGAAWAPIPTRDIVKGYEVTPGSYV